jgi:hypothetical protein
MSQEQAMDVGQTIHCLEVLHAVQTDSALQGGIGATCVARRRSVPQPARCGVKI